MRFEKRQIQALLFIVICMILYTGWYVQGKDHEEYIPGIIRFHVIANSNSDKDQALKLQVRDGVLEVVNSRLVKETMEMYDSVNKAPQVQNSADPELASETMAMTDSENTAEVSLDIDQSRKYLQDNLAMIEEEAEKIIAENGYNYQVHAELGVRWIPEKTYGDMTFPAGNYEALNITIGAGEGENWWCVLFPPLCLIDGSDNNIKEKPYDPNATPSAVGLTDELIKLRLDNKNNVTTEMAITLKFKTLELLNK